MWTKYTEGYHFLNQITKMKKNSVITLFLLFNIYSTIDCQNTLDISKFSFSFEFTPPTLRWFDNKLTKPNEFTHSGFQREHPSNWNDFPISIGYELNKKTSLQLGTYKMRYLNGVYYDIPNCTNSFKKENDYQVKARHFFAKVYHTPFQIKILGDPLQFNFGLGYVFAHSIQDGFGSSTIILPCDLRASTLTTIATGSTGDFQKNFHLIVADVKLAYDFSDYVSVTTSFGFNQGFKTLSIFRLRYELTGEPIRYSESATKGSNIYWNFGFRFRPFQKREKVNKQLVK